MVNDTIESDPKSVVVNEMAVYFSTIADSLTLCSHINSCTTELNQLQGIKAICEEKQVINIVPLYEKEVEKALQEIKIKKASGWDGSSVNYLNLQPQG